MAPTKNIIMLILPLFIITAGCIEREKEPKPPRIIPQDKISQILTDLYMADGLLNQPQIRKEFDYKDSTENYMDIIESYGYTKEELDENISYLFVSNPKKLEAVYDRVLANLSRIEADNISELEKTTDEPREYYTGKSSISLPDNGITDKIEIDIPIDRPGQYIVKSRILIHTDDQSINPFINLWYWYEDSTETGHIEPWDTLWLNKTGKSELITLSKPMIDSSATNIRGFLFNHTDQQGHWEKHAQYSNISVTRTDQAPIIHRQRSEK